ncbi:MAG TPA: GH92 family glycosyl hydrolase [Mycobacteriales bacterium]|nr:GH92 family glycosyl hydrolase [Mycobacteriales bacterium]
MRKVRWVVCVAALAVAASVIPSTADSGSHEAPGDAASWVNPFIGSDASAANFGTGGGAGNTFPGATVPFGMVQWSPDTVQNDVSYVGGYGWRDDHIAGFGLTHMSGAGCSVYRDLPFLPTTAPLTASPAQPFSSDLAPQFQPAFDHRHEVAEPGYYAVTLDPNTPRAIRTELSATTRTGAARLTFPRTRTSSVLVNAGGSAMADADATVHVDPARREISGSATSGRFCYQGGNYTVYFAAVFDRPFASYGTWQRQVLQTQGTDAHDISALPENYGPVPGGPKRLDGDPSGTAQAGAYAQFDTRRNRVVGVRVGVSFVSVAEARHNLAAEQPSFGFDRVRRAARTAWDRELGRAIVQGGTSGQRTMFATALYHALLQPRTFSDADGRYPGMDGNVHVARGWTMYADFSGWDVYRTQIPLLALLEPQRASDVVRSLLADEAQSGWLPKWSFADQHTAVMTGDPADPAIASTWALGARHFDVKAALAAMVHGATTYGADAQQRYVERPGLVEYANRGYVPAEEEHHLGGIAAVADPAAVWGPASTTLEYATADFAVGALARAACRQTATTRQLLDRSASWRTLFDPATGYVEPRSASGAFLPTFSPTSGDGFVEGDAAQYTFAVPHDPAALVSALGGRVRASARLDRFFTKLNDGPTSPYAFLGNEPNLHVPYLYDWTGQPWRTQQIVRRAMLSLYSPGPGGMPGNDDLGTMSAWWVFSALGLYPVQPATDVLAVGAPLFPHAVVHLAHGDLRIDAAGAPRAGYVGGLALDGRPVAGPWVHAGALLRGATLRFSMSRRPVTGWGSDPSDAPPSGAAAVGGCR